MYVVVEIGSSQFKVREGDIISPNRLPEGVDEEITLNKVLMYANEDDVRVGKPYLDNVKVSAKVKKHDLDEKVVAFKYRRRKDSAVKKGHRQKITNLMIVKIDAN